MGALDPSARGVLPPEQLAEPVDVLEYLVEPLVLEDLDPDPELAQARAVGLLVTPATSRTRSGRNASTASRLGSKSPPTRGRERAPSSSWAE